MARAGRIRPNTMSPGILTTPRVRPVSTITLSTTLVKRPKNAFQSPGTHQRTGCSVLVTLAMCPPVCALAGSVHQDVPTPTLTPALSLSEGEGAGPIPSPPEGERVG